MKDKTWDTPEDELPPDVALLVVAARRWVEQTWSNHQTNAAKALDVKQGQLSTFLNHGRGIGFKMLAGLSRVHYDNWEVGT